MSDVDTSSSAADLRRAVEDKSRLLAAKQNQLLSLMKGTVMPTGEREVQPHQADQIRELEGQCVALTDQVNALKLDYIQARTEEDLNRRASESLGPPIHVGSGGNGGEAGQAFTQQAAKGRIPADLGEAFVESAGYKSWQHGGQGQMAHLEIPTPSMRQYALKATLTTATGPFTSIDKQPDVVILGTQPFTVADLMTQAQTANTTIRYIREDTLTNAAAMVPEEGSKPEATWDLSEVDVTVKKIAVIARTTTEMFEDYMQVRGYVNDRIPWMVRQRVELQLLSGDGTGNNLLGVLSVPGILTQAKGTNNNIDTLYLAITKVRTQGFWEPDAIVIHPNNWSAIRLLKTTQGEYEYGHPAIPGPETIFGKRVVVTANMTANTAIVGAWKIGSTLYYRHGIRVEATNSDASDFQFNRVAIRGEQREAAVWWRPTAFCTATGLDVLP